MKTSAWISGVARLGCVVALQGCGAGTYHIPNVEPVVKQKPDDDLLEDIEGGGDEDKKDSTDSASPAPDSEKPSETPAPEAAKPGDAKGPKASGTSKK